VLNVVLTYWEIYWKVPYRTSTPKLNLERHTKVEQRDYHLLNISFAASDYSANRQFYGDFHNMGHVAISFTHDPFYRHKVSLQILKFTVASATKVTLKFSTGGNGRDGG